MGFYLSRTLKQVLKYFGVFLEFEILFPTSAVFVLGNLLPI
jgi:hypothetical protein